MSYYSIPPLISSILFLILGLFCYSKNRKSKLNITFALMCLSTIWWQGTWAILFNVKDPHLASILVRFGYIGITFIPITFYHFIIVFLQRDKEKKLVYASYVTGIILVICLWSTHLYINGYYTFPWGYYPKAGLILHPAYLLMLTLQALRMLYLLYVNLRNKSLNPSKLNQIRYMFWAIFFYTFASVDFADNYGLEMYPLGFVPIIIFMLIVGYTIIRYRLMDINLIIRGGLQFLSYIIIAFALVMPILVICRYSFRLNVLAVMFLMASAPFIYQYLRNRSLTIIDFLFFRGKFDYHKKLAETLEVIPTIIDRDKLLQYVVNGIGESMRIKKCFILIKDDYGDYYRIAKSIGLDEYLSSKIIQGNTPLIQWMRAHKDAQVKYELYQMLPFEEAEKLWAELIPFESEVVVPLHKGDIMVGMICISNKSGGNIFTDEDFRILQTIAGQLAVVIENIRLYDRIIHTDRQTFLETLASGISHEMRNRLVAIRTFIDLFPERVDMSTVSPGFIEFRELAVREMERLTKMIDGLLTYSRAVTKGGEYLNINELIDEALMIIESKIKKSGIELTKNLDEKIPGISGDKGRLLQVFINIIQNGIEAMQKGGKMTITSVDKEEDVEINIADNGKGISKEHLDAIFEPFFTTKHNGTGLGLSIVQRIVKDHSGIITVQSEVGKGTTFTISFNKKGGYNPSDISPKEGMKYWDVKKEYEDSDGEDKSKEKKD